jgi:Putative Ig domain
MALCALAACGDGGHASPAALKLSYNGSMPFPAVVGEAIVLTPAVSGPVGLYRVRPALPSGLSIDELSGVIAGTPTKASPPATYVVSASGAGVSASFPLALSVTEPPSNLSYVSPVSATVGEALAPMSPSISGTADHYAVSPTLPLGIVLNSTSGILSGTPREAKNLEPYTITASSLAGDTRFILLLAVSSAPPGVVPKHRLPLPDKRSSTRTHGSESAAYEAGSGRGRTQHVPSQDLPAFGMESSGNIHAGVAGLRENDSPLQPS